MRKRVFGVSDQVRHKPRCTTTEMTRNFRIEEIDRFSHDTAHIENFLQLYTIPLMVFISNILLFDHESCLYFLFCTLNEFTSSSPFDNSFFSWFLSGLNFNAVPYFGYHAYLILLYIKLHFLFIINWSKYVRPHVCFFPLVTFFGVMLIFQTLVDYLKICKPMKTETQRKLDNSILGVITQSFN